ncbi:unnamed protein product [Amoebophrya sp. A120]|nr:unnamed protein product [Amoebophrya sp. A120]|eukprot:GSA120T00011343001.1
MTSLLDGFLFGPAGVGAEPAAAPSGWSSYEVHQIHWNPLVFWGGFFEDFVAFWQGAPLLIDFGDNILTVLLNRLYVLSLAPYVILVLVVLVVASATAAQFAVKTALRHINCWIRSSSFSTWRNFLRLGGQSGSGAGTEELRQTANPGVATLSETELRKLPAISPTTPLKGAAISSNSLHAPAASSNSVSPPNSGAIDAALAAVKDFVDRIRLGCQRRLFPRVDSVKSIASTVSTAAPAGVDEDLDDGADASVSEVDVDDDIVDVEVPGSSSARVVAGTTSKACSSSSPITTTTSSSVRTKTHSKKNLKNRGHTTIHGTRTATTAAVDSTTASSDDKDTTTTSSNDAKSDDVSSTASSIKADREEVVEEISRAEKVRTFRPEYVAPPVFVEHQMQALAATAGGEKPLTGSGQASSSSSSSRIPEEKPTWTIYGKQYDLTKFMASHPGGSWPLILTKNSDCTILFESYHTFISRDKLDKMMGPYEIKTPEVEREIAAGVKRRRLPPADPLQEDLRQFARDFFKDRAAKPNGSSSTGPRGGELGTKLSFQTVGKPHNLTFGVCTFMICVYLLCWVCVYFMFTRGSLVATLMLPLLQWLYGASISHDASHFAAFPNDTVNRFASLIGGFPLMFNHAAWTIQHVIQHHQFTNLIDDVDLFHFRPLVRASRLFNKAEWHTKWQLALIIAVLPTTSLHLNVMVPLDLLLEVPVFVGPFDDTVPEAQKFQFRYEQCRHLKSLMKDLWKPMAMELACVALWWVVGVYCLGPFQYFLLFCPMIFVASWVFLLFTQGAHINEPCESHVEANARKRLEKGTDNVHPYEIVGYQGSTQDILKLSDEDLAREPHPNPMMGRWVREQIAYTADFCPDSYFWYIISGGLNMQSIHHCMPGISHSHYTAMYPGYVEVLKKHGVVPRIVPTFPKFAMGFFSWINELGNVDEKEELDWAAVQQLPLPNSSTAAVDEWSESAKLKQQ